MVLIMITTWIPQGKEAKAGAKYIEVMREHESKPFEKGVLPLGVVSAKKGTKVLSIVKIKEGRYEEAIKLITKRLLGLSSVEGLHYKIETMLDGEEALSLIGLGIPKQVPM
ncbi:MAG: hypothetical protein JW891_03865 [Candidatus Lokiarchaeota archaeon]|nr:hypothetical protein [Candidatus Lokiarchaeota archaeon]